MKVTGKRHEKKRSLTIFIICYVAYTTVYIARLSLSIASPGLIESNLLDSSRIGILGSAFSIVYACGRLINGQISDKQPPWVMLSVGLVGAGISNILFGFFPPFIGIMLLWMTNAFAQSMLWSSIICVVSALYDEQKAKKMTSYMVTSVAIGNILGIIINTYIITTLGLRYAFILPGVFVIISSTFIFFSTRKIKNTNRDNKNHVSVFKLLKNRNVRLLLVPTVFHGAIKDNISLWMSVYFVDKFAVNLEESALFILFIPIIGFMGRMFYPLCYKVCKEDEHKVSVVGFGICTLAVIPLFTDIINPIIAVICLSLLYAAISVVNTSMASIFPIRFSKTGNVASMSGLMDFITYSGAGIGSAIYGFVIKSVGYTPMFVSWAVICAISLIFLKYTINQK